MNFQGPSSVIGKSVPRPDGIEKVTGNAVYCDDIRLPGLLHGKILRSPYAHAKILRIDTNWAEKLRGVRAVITWADTPCVKYGLSIADELPLAKEKVRYIGDEVAAVAAIDESTAEEALDLIRVEYEPLPAVFEMKEALDTKAPLIHDAERNIAKHMEVDRGDVERGFREADFLIENEYTTSFVQTAPIEPISALASFDLSGNLTLYLPLQEIGRSLPSIAKSLDMPAHKIRIIQPKIGGGFGGKNGITPLCPICALLAKKAGKPVRISHTREEELSNARPAVPMKIHMRLGLTKDGRLSAKYTRIMADNGAYSSHGPTILLAAAIRFDSVYRQKNLKTELDLIYTNNIPTGAYRGYGANQVAFALESLMDEAAEKMLIDPIELRLRNSTKEGDLSVHGWKIHSCALDNCLTKAAEASDWKSVKLAKPPRTGIGVAASTHICGLKLPDRFSGSTAIVKMDERGLVSVLTGEGEIGQGFTTVVAQIVSEECALPMEMIRVLELDTQYTPLCLGAFSSRATISGGNAAKRAAADLKTKILEIASEILKCRPSELDIQQGCISRKGSGDVLLDYFDFVTAAAKMGKLPLVGTGSFDSEDVGFDPKTLYGNMATTYSFAAHIAKVKVDPESGSVDILNYVAVHDAGKILNRMAAEGQVEGGVVQGLGFTLTEDLIRSKGRIINSNFMDYKLIKATTIPEIRSIFVESHDPIGPFGAKGLGEEVSVPVAPAVANAIYDAVGVRIRDLPITPEKILRAIKAKRSDEQTEEEG